MKKYKVSVYDHDTDMIWVCEYPAYTAEQLWEEVSSTLGLHEELLLVEEVK